MSFPPATQTDLDTLSQQLQRLPRGVVGVGARCPDGHPSVVITAPRLEDGTPFPTVCYLTCPGAVKACSALEARGEMEHLNQRLQGEPELAAEYLCAHIEYLALRAALGEVPEIEGISAGGMPERVKCLHALVAHALVAGPGVNPIGDAALEIMKAEGLWDPQNCAWKGEEEAR